MVAPRTDTIVIVVDGGGGKRLGGVSEADLMLGGERLIDRVCGALSEACGMGCVAAVPLAVRVPNDVLRTLKGLPSGSPLAGIDAGLRVFGVGDDVLVAVVSVDAPGVSTFLSTLLESALKEGVKGRIVRDGDPESFNQYLMGVHRATSLRHAIGEAMAICGSIRDVGVRQVLRVLNVERVSVGADTRRDIDTSEDVAWWETLLNN